MQHLTPFGTNHTLRHVVARHRPLFSAFFRGHPKGPRRLLDDIPHRIVRRPAPVSAALTSFGANHTLRHFFVVVAGHSSLPILDAISDKPTLSNRRKPPPNHATTCTDQCNFRSLWAPTTPCTMSSPSSSLSVLLKITLSHLELGDEVKETGLDRLPA